MVPATSSPRRELAGVGLDRLPKSGRRLGPMVQRQLQVLRLGAYTEQNGLGPPLKKKEKKRKAAPLESIRRKGPSHQRAPAIATASAGRCALAGATLRAERRGGAAAAPLAGAHSRLEVGGGVET